MTNPCGKFPLVDAFTPCRRADGHTGPCAHELRSDVLAYSENDMKKAVDAARAYLQYIVGDSELRQKEQKLTDNDFYEAVKMYQKVKEK